MLDAFHPCNLINVKNVRDFEMEDSKKKKIFFSLFLITTGTEMNSVAPLCDSYVQGSVKLVELFLSFS